MNYLNTKPLIYGFEQGMMQDKIELIFDYPSKIASKLINDQIDIGLIPVAAIPGLKEYYIVSDFCIACDGEVASVCLFSDVPLHEIETVLLDYQSQTSVALLKILLREYWKISPVLIEGTENYESAITGTTAGLVIGDRAFMQRTKSTFSFDLGVAWKEMTGCPFVFAAWVSNKPLSPEFTSEFNRNNQYGLSKISDVVANNPYNLYDLFYYYTNNIKFKPDFDKLEVITLFLKKINDHK